MELYQASVWDGPTTPAQALAVCVAGETWREHAEQYQCQQRAEADRALKRGKLWGKRQ